MLCSYTKCLDPATPLQFVKGIGPARAQTLEAKGLLTAADLLFYLPFRYEDRRNLKAISELTPGEKAVVLARVEATKLTRFARGRGGQVLEVRFADGSPMHLLARWFHGEWLANSLVSGIRVALFGKVEYDRSRGTMLMVQPETEILQTLDEDEETLHTGRIVPIYEGSGNISTRLLRILLDRILHQVTLPADPLPAEIRERREMPTLAEAIHDVHQPPPGVELHLLNEFRSPAQTRLIFDEFFWMECGLALKRARGRAADGIPFKVTERSREQIKKMLPFKPTSAQRRVTQEIADDMKQPFPMHRLLQGDVGSGKTIVAAQAAVIAVENDYQVAVLAPTEILATQHYLYFERLFKPLGYKTILLTGSATAKEKQKLKLALSTGFVNIAVGTHALIQEDVKFRKLGLAIIDEQHRFGVVQRLSLFKKGANPDVLVMTATPIPRTLALTVYGDLDLSVIDQLPPGRKAVQTKHVLEQKIEGVYAFLAKEVKAGRQTYVVYPVVEESETTAMKAAEKAHQHLSEVVFPSFKVGLLHGKMTPVEKAATMDNFARGETNILVSTTVIEVGVDVSNASVMVIEEADRFGLSQLHQLRGRVGRGPHQSYCILVTQKLGEIAHQRIRTLVDSNDGFYIAEMDMKLRGPGEFFGTRQAGIPGLRFANLIRDADILEVARYEAIQLIESSRQDETRKHALQQVIRHIQEHWQRQYGLVQVG
jgi:ATP-dependent DNA helicase RecG